jgi:hypothetical protein
VELKTITDQKKEGKEKGEEVLYFCIQLFIQNDSIILNDLLPCVEWMYFILALMISGFLQQPQSTHNYCVIDESPYRTFAKA